MIETAVYDTKPYDREYLARTAGAERISWRFHEFRFSTEATLNDEGSHLLVSPNVFITAHQAFVTQEALSEIACVTTANVLKLESRKPYLEATNL